LRDDRSCPVTRCKVPAFDVTAGDDSWTGLLLETSSAEQLAENRVAGPDSGRHFLEGLSRHAITAGDRQRVVQMLEFPPPLGVSAPIVRRRFRLKPAPALGCDERAVSAENL